MKLLIRLTGAITAASPEFQTRPWQAKFYRSLPGHMRDWITKRWPLKNEVVTRNFQPGQMELVFRLKNRDSTANAGSGRWEEAVFKSIDEKKLKLRVRYGRGQYSETASFSRLVDYSISPPAIPGYCTAQLQNVPHTLEELQVELVEPARNGTDRVVHTGTIRNPLYERLEPIGTAVAMPAELRQEDVSVTLLSLGSRTPRQFNELYDAVARGEHPPRAQLPDFAADSDKTHSHTAVIFLTQLRKFRPLPLGVDAVEAFYSNRAIPYNLGEIVAHFQRVTPDGLLQGFLFQNDVAPVGQPVKLVVQLAKRYGFTKEEIFSREIDMPPDRERSAPKPLRVTGPLKHDMYGPHRERLAFAWFGNAVNVPDAPQGYTNTGEFTVMIEDAMEPDRLHSVELIKRDGTTVDLQDYLLRLSNVRGDIWAAFDVKNTRGLSRTPAIKPDDYEKVRINVVCPQQFNVPFEFIAALDTRVQ